MGQNDSMSATLTRPEWLGAGPMRLRTAIILLIVLPVTLVVGVVGWIGIT